MIPLLGGALLAGLTGSPHCIGMCGGFAASCGSSFGDSAGYHLGRLSTYAALGAVAGWFGHSIPGPGWVGTAIAAVLTLAFAASLAGFVRPPKLALPGVAVAATALLRRPGGLARYALGGVTALLPCGLVYAALGLPIAVADPLWGALAMVFFGLGTVPLLAGASVGLRRLIAQRPRLRVLLAAAVLLAGWTSIGARHVAGAQVDAGPAAARR